MTLNLPLLALIGIAAFATPALAASEDAMTPDTHNMELGLPYEPPGRGITDHEALRRRILTVMERQFGAFVTETETLDQIARAHCAGSAPLDDLQAQFAKAYVAWAPLDSYQFGPIQQTGAVLAVNFWPDKKGFVGRGLQQLLSRPDGEQADPTVIAASGVAVQGFPALELLLHTDAPACPAAVGISGNLNRLADDLYAAWFGANGWADIARTAGPDNPVYLSADEFTKTIYTAIDFGLVRIIDTRFGRPLGTFDRPYPERAEAWRSDLTGALIVGQLDGLAEMIEFGFAGDIREPDRAWVLRVFRQARDRVTGLEASIHDSVTDPMLRFQVEAAQTRVIYAQSQVAQDIGPQLGVDTGFSAADGD